MSDRLSQWIDWNRAVSLSRALDGRLPAVAESSSSTDDAEACRQARAMLTERINAFRIPAAGPASTNVGDAGDAAADGVIDFAPFKKHGLDVQRATLASTGRLRGRLRDRLAQVSPQFARLAELDAEMEAVLSPHEHTLLALIPALLERHFSALRDADAHPQHVWLETFRRDQRDVLLGELDIRFQPIEALLAALRTS